MTNSVCELKPAILLIFGALFLGLVAGPAPAATDIEAARVKEIAAELPPKPAGFGRPITDRAVWAKLAQTPVFASVVPEAQKLSRKPVPALPDDLYLDFSKTGNRIRCQSVLHERSNRIVTFTLAECLENRGRFVRPLTETVEALCAEKAWTYPAHDRKLDNFYGRTVEMDLRATAVAWELATADYLLGDKLPPATRRLIRDNVQRRVLQPFRDMVRGRRPEIFWMRATHNWNAVCLAGVTGAALALEESPEDRAWFVVAAQYYVRFFLSGFTPDGYCSEGVGYWNYGFGHFLMLGEAIRQATANRTDLLADPAALQPAHYGLRTEVLNGIYPTIADCHPGSRPAPEFVRYICERLGLEAPGAGRVDFTKPSGSLAATMMFSFLEAPLPVATHETTTPDSPLRTWFNDGGVLICRPKPGSKTPFAAVLKGGNNAEHHNHNDVGSFSVIAGKAMVLCDPGGEVYTARTFSGHRYDSKVLSSYGHAVPVIGGQLQRTGADAHAVVRRADFSDEADTLVLDIRSAYAAPELKRLERTFIFRRGESAALTVRDEAAFSEPRSFETTLITWGNWKKLSEKELLVSDEGGAVRVRIDTGGEPFKISAERLNEDVSTRTKPLRLGIALNSPVNAATVTLTITPELNE
jgi:Heparinase II/III-like protein